jgi:hypothetical protein
MAQGVCNIEDRFPSSITGDIANGYSKILLSKKFLQSASSLLEIQRSEAFLNDLWYIEQVTDFKEIIGLGKI